MVGEVTLLPLEHFTCVEFFDRLSGQIDAFKQLLQVALHKRDRWPGLAQPNQVDDRSVVVMPACQRSWVFEERDQ